MDKLTDNLKKMVEASKKAQKTEVSREEIARFQGQIEAVEWILERFI